MFLMKVQQQTLNQSLSAGILHVPYGSLVERLEHGSIVRQKKIQAHVCECYLINTIVWFGQTFVQAAYVHHQRETKISNLAV